MRNITPERMKRRIAAAAKREPADLVIRNGQIIDVFNAEVMTGDVAVVDGFIIGIGEFTGHTVIDAANRFICPAFLDGHMHIESAMMTPDELAKVLLPHGVTTIIADPHEIANVAGIDGITFMLDQSAEIPLDVYFMLPSCVPATPYEHSGATILAKHLESLLAHPRVLGLAEVMDYPSVRDLRPDMIDKLIMAANTPHAQIDGHAAGLNSTGLNIYRAAGIRTDHECVTAEEAKERLQRGMYVMIREGSVAKNLLSLIPAVTEQNARRCLFVTDDKHLDDLMDEGSIDYMVRLAIDQGISPMTAIRMATLNTAECFHLAHIGAIAPGYQADFLLLDDLQKVAISEVYKNGQCVARNGVILPTISSQASVTDDSTIPVTITNSVNLPPLSKDQLTIPLESSRAHVIEIIPNSLYTRHLIEEVTNVNNRFEPSVSSDLLKIAVIERHHQTGHIGLGIIKGLGLQKGAIASTVAHDSHNLIIAGCNDDDMLYAAEQIQQIQGGLIVVADGAVLASLPLPLAGLLTGQDAATTRTRLDQLNKSLRSVGVSTEFNPFLTLSFLALPVIPELKITDLGLFDVRAFQHIPIEAKQ